MGGPVLLFVLLSLQTLVSGRVRLPGVNDTCGLSSASQALWQAIAEERQTRCLRERTMSRIRPICFALAGCGIALVLLTLGGCKGCDVPIPEKQLEVHYLHDKTCRVWFDTDGPGNTNPLLEFQIVSVKNISKAGTPPVRFFLSKVFYREGDTRHFEEPTPVLSSRARLPTGKSGARMSGGQTLIAAEQDHHGQRPTRPRTAKDSGTL
jgi:hypothetical protein